MSFSRAALVGLMLGLVSPAAAHADQLTVRGTKVFTSVAPDAGTQYGAEFAVFNGFLYFVANDDVHGRELWRTDGTDAGTALVADLYPGLPNTNSDPHRLTVVGDRLFFNARNAVGASTETVFYIDAAQPTTVKQPDARLTTSSAVTPAIGSILGAPNGRVIISRLVGEQSNCCYAVYALAPGGTTFEKISAGNESVDSTNVFSPSATAGGWMYYDRSNVNVSPGEGGELWRTNGTVTEEVANIYPDSGGSKPGSSPNSFVATSDRVYFVANDGAHGSELWVTNPADKADTHIVYEHVPGTGATSINDPGAVANGNILYYVPANDPATGSELWRTDGTLAGTRVVKDITPGPGGQSGPIPFAFKGGVGFLRGSDIFFSDGTDPGTALLNTADGDGYGPNTPVAFGNQAYFVGGASPFGQALWRTDGTAAGTFPLSAGGFDGTSATSGNPIAQTLAVLGSKLIFFSRDPSTANSGFVKMNVIDTALPDEQRTATVAPAVTGTAEVGKALSVSKGTWSGRPTTYAYQWQRNGQPIDKATDSAYSPVAADVGQLVAARVTTTGIGAPRVAAADSNAVRVAGTAPPVGGPPPTGPPTTVPPPTALPGPALKKLTVSKRAALRGEAKVGKKLRLTLPKLVQPGVTFSIRWAANGTTITKQTKTSLRLTRRQKGKRITATITVRRAGFTTLTLRVGPSKKVRA